MLFCWVDDLGAFRFVGVGLNGWVCVSAVFDLSVLTRFGVLG